MNKKDALTIFADVVENACPIEDCAKPVGELCDTPGVWVHFERFELARPRD